MFGYFRFERILGAMKRFHAKIQRIREGIEAFYPDVADGEVEKKFLVGPLIPKPEGDDPNKLQDYVLAFFIFSHSFKDWIINDDEVGGLKEDRRKWVEAFINDHECLKIAADIANGAKHLERDAEPRSGSQPEWLLTQSHVGNAFLDGYLKVVVRSSGSFHWGAKEIDAFTLASECLSKWEEFAAGIYKEREASVGDAGLDPAVGRVSAEMSKVDKTEQK